MWVQQEYGLWIRMNPQGKGHRIGLGVIVILCSRTVLTSNQLPGRPADRDRG